MGNRRLNKLAFLCLAVIVIAAGLFFGEVQAAIPNYNCALQKAIPEDQCLALVKIYESTAGADWTVSTNWLESEDPCNWHGVSCLNGTVVALDLFNNNLTGELPLDIGALPDLETLTVNNNPLKGPVPLTITMLDLRLFHFHNTGLCEPADPTFQDWLFGVVYRFSSGVFCSSPPPSATLPPAGPTYTNTPEVEPTSTDFPPQQTLTALAVIAVTEQAAQVEITPTKYYQVNNPTPEPTEKPALVSTDVPTEGDEPLDEADVEPSQEGGLLAGISKTWLLLLLIPVGLIAVGLLLELRERRKEEEPYDVDEEVTDALFKLDYFEPNDKN